MTAKRAVLVATPLAGALMVLAWSQTWWVIESSDGLDSHVAGSVPGGGVLAAGLATLAAAAALALAPSLLRYILGVVVIGTGLVTVAVCIAALADPVMASVVQISEETGISGDQSIVSMVTGVAVTAWPWVAVAAGILAALAGVAVILTAHRWPVSGSRYERAPAEPEAWDVLTEGDDPTR